MSRVPIQALHEIVYDKKYAQINIRRFIANSIERHESTLSRVLDESAKLDQDQSARLGRDLCDEYNDTRWTRCYVGSTYLLVPRTPGSPNGRWDDDAAHLMDAGGKWFRKMGEGDRTGANVALDRIRGEILPTMQDETDKL